MNTSVTSEPYNYPPELLHSLYGELLAPRLFEEKMINLVRQGRLAKWFPGIGQEAVSIGACAALNSDEYVLTQHRNLGAFLSKGIPVDRLMSQFLGKANGYTKGRDRSFYFASKDNHLIGSITHLGVQASVGDGLALASKLRNEGKVVLVFCGDGGTSEGEWHEAVNLASVWDLPILFVIQNNGYALSTPTSEQFRCNQLVDRAQGYGVEGRVVDGNDLLAVYEATKSVAEVIRSTSRPVILECMTFRMYGHELSSGTKYVPQELIDYWAARDPIKLFEDSLKSRNLLTDSKAEEIRGYVQANIEEGVESAFAEEEITADAEREEGDIYAPTDGVAVAAPSGSSTELRFIDAITDALKIGMEQNPDLVVMGQDVAEYGGVFKVTEGFLEQFGKERVRNTPLCESAIVGAAVGLAFEGFSSIIEMQFADFASNAFTQITANLARLYYRTGQTANVVVRMPCGGGVGAGPYHSQSNEAWFLHSRGVKMVYPSNPYDAKGLLIASLEDPNPVIFFEHKKLYRSLSAEVPEGHYTVELSKAKTVRSGEQLTLLTYGMGVHWAEDVLAELPDYSVELIDLRTLVPLDFEAIKASIEKTGRVLILHEASLTGGFGAELSARISSELFDCLDAPIKRCASLDTVVPFGSNLEDDYLASSRLKDAIEEIIAY